MKTYTHRLEIGAPADTLWQLTTDVEGWPALFPTITSVVRLDPGPLKVGSTARIKQPGQAARIWTVTECEAPRRFVWVAQGLGFSMRALHTITPVGDRRATNELTIELDGPLRGLLGALAGGRIQEVLATENEGFRKAAEAAAPR